MPAPPPVPPGAVITLEQVEKQAILAALARNEGNQTRTASELDIGTATLYRKLKRYGAGDGEEPPN